MIEHVYNAIGAILAHFVSIGATLDWLQWLLLAGLMFLAFVLLRCQMAPDDFDLRHLIVSTESGKIDRFAFAYVTGLIFVCWFFVYYTTAGKLTEWYAALCVVYWAAPKSIEAWMAARKAP